MNSIRDDHPELAEFLGAYFNQDFALDYSSYDSAVDEFLDEAPTAEWATAVVRDIDELLARRLSESDLHTYVVLGAMGIEPDQPTSEFLRRIRDRISGRS